MMKVLPSMVKYLQNLINRRNGKTFDKLITDMKNKSFGMIMSEEFKKHDLTRSQPAKLIGLPLIDVTNDDACNACRL
jgi:hypothetical protein